MVESSSVTVVVVVLLVTTLSGLLGGVEAENPGRFRRTVEQD